MRFCAARAGWARGDSNPGPSPCKGDVITELDHRPAAARGGVDLSIGGRRGRGGRLAGDRGRGRGRSCLQMALLCGLENGSGYKTRSQQDSGFLRRGRWRGACAGRHGLPTRAGGAAGGHAPAEQWQWPRRARARGRAGQMLVDTTAVCAATCYRAMRTKGDAGARQPPRATIRIPARGGAAAGAAADAARVPPGAGRLKRIDSRAARRCGARKPVGRREKPASNRQGR